MTLVAFLSTLLMTCFTGSLSLLPPAPPPQYPYSHLRKFDKLGPPPDAIPPESQPTSSGAALPNATESTLEIH